MKCVLCLKDLNKKNGPYFRVPADESRRQRWNMACSRNFKNGSRVCYRHFKNNDFAQPPDSNLAARLKVGAVPYLTRDVDEECPQENISVIGVNFDVIRIARVSCCTQTDAPEIWKNTLLSVSALKQRVKDLELELSKTKAELEKATALNASMTSVFTAGQIKKIQQPELKYIQ